MQTTPTQYSNPPAGNDGRMFVPPVANDERIILPPVANMLAPVSPRRREYLDRQSLALGICQITVGVLCIIFNIVAISLGDRIAYVAHGIWCGILFIITGSFGIGAAKSKTKCLIVTFMVFCILSATMTLTLLSIGIAGACTADTNIGCDHDYYYGYGYDSYYPYYNYPCYNWTNYRSIVAMESLIAILAVIEAVVAILGSAICCKSVCCCYSGVNVNPNAYPQVLYPNHQQVMFVSQQQQMQSGGYQPQMQAQYWNAYPGYQMAPAWNQYPPPPQSSQMQFPQVTTPPAYAPNPNLASPSNGAPEQYNVNQEKY